MAASLALLASCVARRLHMDLLPYLPPGAAQVGELNMCCAGSVDNYMCVNDKHWGLHEQVVKGLRHRCGAGEAALPFQWTLLVADQELRQQLRGEEPMQLTSFAPCICTQGPGASKTNKCSAYEGTWFVWNLQGLTCASNGPASPAHCPASAVHSR